MFAMLLSNAGTPLMWASCFHLFFGNFFIGLLEAHVIARISGKPVTRRLVAWLVGANYTSAGAAWVFFILKGDAYQRWFETNINFGNVVAFQFAIFGIAFACSILVEWPFVQLGLKTANLARGLGLSVCAQAVSYACLLVYYGLFNQGLLWPLGPLRAVALEEMRPAPAGWAYFIDEQGKALRRVRLDGSGEEVVQQLSLTEKPERLAVEVDQDGKGWFCVDMETAPRQRLETPPTILVPSEPSNSSWPGSAFSHTDLRSPGDRDWTIHTSYIGMTARRRGQWWPMWVSLHTPMGTWRTDFFYLLPGENVVFQLESWVVRVDLGRREIAPLVRGVGLVIVPEEPASASASFRVGHGGRRYGMAFSWPTHTFAAERGLSSKRLRRVSVGGVAGYNSPGIRVWPFAAAVAGEGARVISRADGRPSQRREHPAARRAPGE